MALPATAVIQVQSTANDSNGGGFNSALGGTDYSVQDSAQATGTVTSVTTTVTATTSIFTSVMVGNYITDGTTWKEITAFTSATIVTVDSAPSWTAANINVGGALASLGKAATICVSGNTVWIKASASYTVSSGIVFSSLFPVWVFGYTSTRGDGGQVTLLAGANSIIVLSSSICSGLIANFVIDNNSKTSVTGISNAGANGSLQISNIKVLNASSGFSLTKSGGNGIIGAFKCIADTCTTGYTLTNGNHIYACWSKTCTTGVNMGTGNNAAAIVNSWITGGTTGVTMGGGSSAIGCAILNSVITGQSGNGITINAGGAFGSGALAFTNNIIYGCGGWGIQVTNISAGLGLLFSSFGNNAYGNNTSGDLSGYPSSPGDIALTANPFTNSVSNDYSLNNTAGGGASCRAAGFPGIFPGSTSTGHLDIGALQHQDSGGGSSGVSIGRIMGGF